MSTPPSSEAQYRPCPPKVLPTRLTAAGVTVRYIVIAPSVPRITWPLELASCANFPMKNDATATVAAPSSNPFRAADVFVPHSENKLLINWDQLRDTPVAVPSKSLVKDESRLLIQWDPANGRKV